MKRTFMKAAAKTFTLFLTVAILAVGVGMSGTAQAALPQPNFMPGFPMLAGEQVILMWSPIPGAVKYNVYLNGKKVAESAAMQHIQPNLKEAGEYRFQVSAVEASGAESPLSAEKTITIINVEPPENPVFLPAEDRIALRWESAKGAVIYDIFRREKGGGEFSLLASVRDTRYEDSQLETGVTYEYAIKSKDAMGKASDFSSLIEAALTVQAVEATVVKEAIIPLRNLPASLLTRVDLPFFPSDIDIRGTQMVVGAGPLVYWPRIDKPEFFESWEVLAPEMSGVLGVAFSRDGKRIYAAHQGKVKVVDIAAGEVVQTITIPRPDPGMLLYGPEEKPFEMDAKGGAFDIVEGEDGSLYVSDNSNYRVVKLSSDGEYLETIGLEESDTYNPSPPWRIFNAGYISLDDTGTLYITEGTSIIRLTTEGKRLNPPVGKMGVGFGEFNKAAGHSFDTEGYFYTADQKSSTLQSFTFNADHAKWEPLYAFSNESKDAKLSVMTTNNLMLSEDRSFLFVLESIAKRVAVFSIDWSNADPI